MAINVPWVAGIDPLKLAVMAKPYGGDWLEDNIRDLRKAGVDMLVSMLTLPEQVYCELDTCADVCTAHGIEFLNIPITDRMVPRHDEPIRNHARELAARLEAGRGIVFHCFAGIGRSPLMAACTLAVLGHDPVASFQRIGRARALDVPDTAEQFSWTIRFANTLRQREMGL